MIALVDNYDSFTYNLVQSLRTSGASLEVFRNDVITVDEIDAMNPAAVVVSPGPCTPNEAGISIDVVKHFSGRVPLLGVCLGHQSVAAAFGAKISSAQRIMHGKVSMVTYDDTELYRGLRNPFEGGRYHSLAIEPDTIPSELIVDARSEDGEIMGLHHAVHATYGVQFHPESVLTPEGDLLLENFLRIVDAHKGAKA
jgi:anthranilate synthase component 2